MDIFIECSCIEEWRWLARLERPIVLVCACLGQCLHAYLYPDLVESVLIRCIIDFMQQS